MGDIHQPLHVGAEFFDSNGKPFEPTPQNVGFADQGGNKLTLFTFVNGQRKSAGKFHGYWDSQTVENAFGTQPDAKVAQRLGSKEPEDWELSGGVETWAEQLANDILPTAREAHERLQYKNIQFQSGKPEISSGRAEERAHARRRDVLRALGGRRCEDRNPQRRLATGGTARTNRSVNPSHPQITQIKPLDLYSRYKLSKRMLDGVKRRSTVPVGPLRCFAMISSATFF